MKRKRGVAVLLCLALIFSAAGCSAKQSGNDTIVILDGNFSEMKLVHQMVKQLVEAHTKAKVEIKDEVSAVNSYKALLKGDCDLMNSYDGTLLTTYLKLDPKDVPKGKSLYDYANQVAEKEHHIRLLDKLGTDNTYAIAVPQAIADKDHLTKISDLIPVAGQMVFGAEHEFFSEEGSMKYNPFVKFYGLNFKASKPVDLSLKYTAVANGDFQVTEVYATDGLNRKYKLKILKDDRSFFPEYNGALLVRDDLFTRFKDEAPNLEQTLNLLGGKLTNETMTDLTYQVDVEGKTPHDVAEAFLKQKSLV